MKTYNKLYLDFTSNNTDIVTAVEDDTNSRYLDVYLLNNGLAVDLTGEEVKIYAEKPDGTTIFNNGEITEPENGRCQFLLTTQLLSVPGIVKCQISTWKDNEQILTTLPFNIVVTKSLRNDETIESSNEYGALVILFQDYYEAKALMTEVVIAIGKPSEDVVETGVNTVWDALEKIFSDMKANTSSILDSITSNITTNTASILNSITDNANKILNLIGNTGQTGGTAATGTIFSKLNKLLTDWTTTRAGKIDEIYDNTSTLITSTGLKPLKKYQKLVPIEEGATFQKSFNTPGKIEYFYLRSYDSTSQVPGLKITIDGVTIFNETVNLHKNGSSDGVFNIFNIGRITSGVILDNRYEEFNGSTELILEVGSPIPFNLEYTTAEIELSSLTTLFRPVEIIIFYR